MIELTKQTTIGEIPIVVRKEGLLSEGKWYAKTYEDFKKIGEPSKKWYEGQPVVSEKAYTDLQLNRNMKRGDRKVTSLITYVYVDEDYSCPNGFMADDIGCVYLNDEWLVKINNFSEYYQTIFEFKKGWNKIEIIYWNGTGSDGVEFEHKLSFDKNIKKIQYDIDEDDYKSIATNVLEDYIVGASIKPITNQKSNIFDRNLLSSEEAFSNHSELEMMYTMPEPKFGGTRFRMDHNSEHTTTGDWRWYWTKVSMPKFRAFLVKPNTKYTITYYIHEYINEIPFSNGGHPSPYIWCGDNYYSYSKTPGMHTLTFTSDRTSHYNSLSPLRVCYHAYAADVIPEGARRVLDIEIISMVEGEEAELKSIPYFSSVGGENGFTVYSQDYDVRVGEYELGGDLPQIIQDIDNRIEKKNNEFNISWI